MRKFPLSDIADIVDCEHKTAPKVTMSRFYSIRTTDISNGKIIIENANRVSEETYREWTKRAVPSAGDIILAREAPVGEVGWINDGYMVCLGQRTVLIKVTDKNVSKRYLLYYFVNPDTKHELQVRSVGSVVSHLNMKDIRSFEIALPKIEEQKSIASILSSLDDKIDLLHRQNKTLEAMAETLFRQWFVEGAREDWESGTIDDLVSIKGGTTPSTKNPVFWDGTVPWSSPRDLSNQQSIFLFQTERRISEAGLAQIGSGLLPIGTVLLSSRAPIGYLAISDISLAINQGYIGIICDKKVSNHYIYLWCKVNMEEIKNAGNGSTFEEISKSNFKALSASIPPEDLLEQFENLIRPIFDKIRVNQIQTNTLVKLRDQLLPKLMSGEVRVS